MSQLNGNAISGAAPQRANNSNETKVPPNALDGNLAASNLPLDYSAGAASDNDVAFSLTDFGLYEIITSHSCMVQMTNPELLPDLELFGSSFVDTISRERVKFENEISEDERASLVRAIDNAVDLAQNYAKNLALLADPLVMQNLTKDLVETMSQGGVYYHFPLKGANGTALDAVFPPPLNRDSIEFRPGHKQGPIWIPAEANNGLSAEQLVPLSAIRERLVPLDQAFLDFAANEQELYAF